MRNYSDCYTVLGVTPDTKWEALRARYKRLMGQWHPDRFSGDTAGKALAEERSKEITLSYKALEKYRRVHGVLPPIEVKTPPASRPEPEFRMDSARPAPGGRAEARGAASEPPARRADPRAGSRAHTIAALIALVIVLAIVQFAFDDSAPENSSRPRDAGAQGQSSPDPTRGISIGSTLGDVYDIQGIPTSTEGDIWHYGTSRIRFLKGRVVAWEEHSDNPLQLSRIPAARFRERLFGAGASKDEVRALQGAPVTEADTVWDYSWMKVYFEHNHVTRWVEFTPPQDPPAR
jgi:hypothetical protein